MNNLKLVCLVAGLTGLCLFVGQAVGGQQGLIFALVFALFSQGIAFWNSDKLALAMNGAQAVSESEAPEIYAMTRRLCERADIPMPGIYITPEQLPNAFATGRDPQHAAIALTQGLLANMNKAELEGVIAHELGHIKNRDTLISTIAAVLASTISSLAQFAFFFGSGRSEDSNPLGALLSLLLAPLAASVIQLAISRSREYTADAAAVEMTGDRGVGLSQALQKLEDVYKRGYKAQSLQPSFSSLYIANPFGGESLKELLSTHPPIPKRIAKIRERFTG